MTVKSNDARKGTVTLDVTDEEADELAGKGRKQTRRGRPRKAQGE